MNLKSISLCITATLLGYNLSFAQPTGGPPPPFKVGLVAIHQFEADIDQGGSLSMTRVGASIDWTKPINRQSAFGLNFAYEVDSYDFGDAGGVFGEDPWGDIENYTLGLSYFRALENGWRVFASPSISSSSEGSIDGDSLLYSIAAGATTKLSDKLNIGLGAVAVSGLEEFRVFPFISIEWQIAENWVIQNPLRAGPTGPAGLEVAYKQEDWSISAGFAYRSWRFRIKGEGATLDGIAEHNGLPVFTRYSRNLTETVSFDLYAGVLLAAEIEIEDENGDGLGLKDDVDPAPFIAISVSGKF